jgi:hypothetical protein
MRKILIGFVSLGVVLGVYLLCTRVSETPKTDADRIAETIKSVADGNTADLESRMGKIGDVGLGPVDKAYYITVNEKTDELEREFGFEKLLHAVRGVWDIEKPYMNVYRRNFTCYLTADKGQVQVETAVGRTTPKDATFSSNVVIHIVPTDESSIKESFVYLDDIMFLSEKSMLSTAGPIRFESEDARMNGTGLELIYNEQAERLEYFKIDDLGSMSYRVTSSQATLFSETQPSVAPPTEPNAPSEGQEPNETMVAEAPKQADEEVRQEGDYYKCVLKDNVLIDTPEQLIFADESLFIHDIFFSKAFIDQSDETESAAPDETENVGATAKAAPGAAEDVAEPNILALEPAGLPAATDDPNDGNEPTEEPTFIVITCDGGLLIVPKASTRLPQELTDVDPSVRLRAGVEATTPDNLFDEQRAAAIAARARQRLDDGTSRTKFYARTIDYNTTTGDVIADGLSELTYFRTAATPALRRESRQAVAAEANEPLPPLKVIAREGATYSKASNQVVFTDCLCTMPQPGLNEQRDVMFSAPKITVDLPEEKAKQPDILATGPVELAFYMEAKKQKTEDGGPTTEVRLPPPEQSPLTPVTVTARKRAHYSAALNQMTFEENCRCTMLREDPNVLEEFVLLSERMTVDLAEDANDRTSGPAAGIEHLTATCRDGGLPDSGSPAEVVRLATTRTAKAGGAFADVLEDANGTGLLGGIELKCRQFDYDAVQQLYWATGPGIIKLNNTRYLMKAARESDVENAEPNVPYRESSVEHRDSKFSLRDPCWAIISGFDTLTYSLLTNRIVADAAPQEKLGIVYLPIGGDPGAADARKSQRPNDVTATASRVEAFLRETTDGQMELATLNATGGIFYEDDQSHQFIGSELFYDHTTAVVKVKGDELQPCYYNGLPVDQIKYDVSSGNVECNVVGPGTIQLGK